MFNSINMVQYSEEKRIPFYNVMIITVESGKKLIEGGLRVKSTHHYYVITTKTTSYDFNKQQTYYFDTKDWFISFKH